VGKGPAITPADLPVHLGNQERGPDGISLAAVEKEHIERVLRETAGNVTQSARLLGIDRATLYNKIKRYGIRR
jgi:transcriptional regulator of acetoin/glycerol metabolism